MVYHEGIKKLHKQHLILASTSNKLATTVTQALFPISMCCWANYIDSYESKWVIDWLV